jgi:hypothetical protein
LTASRQRVAESRGEHLEKFMEACQPWQASLLDSTPMRDQLVRYLLGELNAQEREQLEAELRDSPELQRELAYLQACLPGDCDAGDDEDDRESVPAASAPRGLAERTLDRICSGLPCGEATRDPAAVTAAYDPPASPPSWSIADLTVAGGVFLAVSMLFLPALRQSRDAARRTACADNLRQLGVMLQGYSEQHGGFFPMVTRNENAGIFAVYLLEDDYAGSEELSRLLVCRSSALAEQVAEKQVFIRVPTMCELEVATPEERCMWKRLMGGSYAYPMGYVEGDRHCAVRNEHCPRKPLLADAPSKQFYNLLSDNHGGCGQNVLYHDGHASYQKKSTLPAAHQDQLFLNNAGEAAAGLDRNDTVLGPSDATPSGATSDSQQ